MKKKKEKENEDAFDRLMKLTRLLKTSKVRIAPKGPVKTANKWRSAEPKFSAPAEKPKKSENLVKVGEMEVDPERREEYEAWRKQKEEEQAFRRAESERRIKAERARRMAQSDY